MAASPEVLGDGACAVPVCLAGRAHALTWCWLSPLFFTEADPVRWEQRVSPLGIGTEPVVREGPRSCSPGLCACPPPLG